MKTKIFTFLLLVICYNSYSFSKFKIPINVSPSDAEIWVDGKLYGVGSVIIKLNRPKIVNVLVQRKGYISENIVFKYMDSYFISKGRDKSDPKFKDCKVYSRDKMTHTIKLQEDDNFEEKNKNITDTYVKEKQVYDAKNIVFYGYDFSDFQLSDSKRMGQDIKKYVFTLTGFLVDNLSERKLAQWLKKESVKFNLEPTIQVNKTINNDDLVSPIKHTTNKNSIPSMINKYSIVETSGIGYVIIFECFDNNTKRVSAYSVFFDIATKKPLLIQYTSSHDGNSYNRLSDWSTASFAAIKKLTDSSNNKENKSSKLEEIEEPQIIDEATEKIKDEEKKKYAEYLNLQEKANFNYTNKKYNDAIDNFNQIIELDPSNMNAFFIRAKAKLAIGDIKGALADNNEVIELDPSNSMAYTNRAQCNLLLKNHIEAIKDLNKAIELDPNSYTAYDCRQETRFALNDFVGCMEDCNMAISLNPKLSNSYFYRGKVYFKNGDKTKACENWSKAGQYGLLDAYELIKQNCN